MRKNLFIFIITIIIGIIIFSYYNNNFYEGEILAIKGVYHRDNCDLLNYYNKDKIKFYKNFRIAIDKNNRPCETCEPPYLMKKEIEEKKNAEAEIKMKEEYSKEREKYINEKIRERTQEILNGRKKELTEGEKVWKDSYDMLKRILYLRAEKAESNAKKIGDGIIEKSDKELFELYPNSFPLNDYYLKLEIEKENKEELESLKKNFYIK